MAQFFPLPHIEPCNKRIRAYFAGVCLIDSKKAKLVWEHQYYPFYYFPKSDLTHFYTSVSNATDDYVQYDVQIGHRKAQKFITLHLKNELKDLFKVEFASMDSWFEEDEEVFIHPKDPYKRIDVLQSSRHVRIELNGIEIANSRSPRLLFETGLPVRTYLPKTDCRLDLLEPSPLKTGCPYKGEASYYHVQLTSGTFENLVWWYPTTTIESAMIQGYVAFYDERVDVWVDGEKQERPPDRL